MPEETIKRYFDAWEKQDSSALSNVFTLDAKYAVHPYGIEAYVGIDAIQKYWEANPVTKQINPKPRSVTQLIQGNVAFLEWECTFDTITEKDVQMCGMMRLEFRDGLISDLREHYEIKPK